jgi:hypothetical protein
VKLADGGTIKGYKVESLKDPWSRYTPENTPANVTSVTSQSPSGISAISDPSPGTGGDGQENGQIPHEKRRVTEVTATGSDQGGEALPEGSSEVSQSPTAERPGEDDVDRWEAMAKGGNS